MFTFETVCGQAKWSPSGWWIFSVATKYFGVFHKETPFDVLLRSPNIDSATWLYLASLAFVIIFFPAPLKNILERFKGLDLKQGSEEFDAYDAAMLAWKRLQWQVTNCHHLNDTIAIAMVAVVHTKPRSNSGTIASFKCRLCAIVPTFKWRHT